LLGNIIFSGKRLSFRQQLFYTLFGRSGAGHIPSETSPARCQAKLAGELDHASIGRSRTR